MEYVELHCHSNFSFLDGAAHPEQLIERAVELGYSSLALTDHNGLYGIVQFSQAAKAAGLKAILGSEITLEDDSHLVLLVKDATGYANLSQLLSRAQLTHKKGEARVCREDLEKYHEGLIALSGCVLGTIPSLLLEDKTKEAVTAAQYYCDLFGENNFYLELTNHNLPLHEKLCRRLWRLGQEIAIPCVATNNVHYTTPKGRRLQDVLTCIRHHTTLDQANGLLYPNAERYLKNSDEMAALFALYPEAINNTVAIAERCNFSLDSLETSLPAFSIPVRRTPDTYLRELTYQGAKERYGELTDEVVKQLEHELGLIEKLKLPGYFLIVWDIARFCREQKILAQGRGSAANSAVCYCLGVTAVDPIRLKLLFERFLSEERAEPPDIDIDIANNRREEVIQYVYQKYGREHAAMVCEVISYRGRSAVREVGKALGFSPAEIDRLAKLLSHFSDAAEVEEVAAELDLNCDSRRVQLLIELVREIHRYPRHLGIHSGGMIITAKPLSQIVPLENATMPDRSVIQWDKDDVADVGLVKIDLLGLGMLSLIDIALKLIEKLHNVTIDPAKLDYDDPKVYDFLCTAETVGIFQVESRAQMNTLPRLKPRHFYDLVVEVALIRPGPIQGEMVHPYLRRRNGEEEITYPHPALKPILERTMGVPLFQEQGMQVAIAAAGFTATQADQLRRAMS
ncbi:MAG: error-prone DNA polymerase, partial [bacterium]